MKMIVTVTEYVAMEYRNSKTVVVCASDNEVLYFFKEQKGHEGMFLRELHFKLAGKRARKVTSLDKVNVLESTNLWRKTVTPVAENYPGVQLEHCYIDTAAMRVIADPSQFDVVVTSNLFGDKFLMKERSLVVFRGYTLRRKWRLTEEESILRINCILPMNQSLDSR